MGDIDVAGLVQIGTVMDVKAGQRRARVKFSEGQSGWLYVLQHTGAGVTVENADGHIHKAQVDVWTPKINDRVLALYLPTDGGDGFILGVI